MGSQRQTVNGVCVFFSSCGSPTIISLRADWLSPTSAYFTNKKDSNNAKYTEQLHSTENFVLFILIFLVYMLAPPPSVPRRHGRLYSVGLAGPHIADAAILSTTLHLHRL